MLDLAKNQRGYYEMKNKAKLNMRLTLLLFALIPLFVASLTEGIVSVVKSKQEIRGYTHDSLVQVISGVGNSFDSMVLKNKEILKGCASAPVFRDLLLDPDNPEKAARAQQYTLDFFGGLDGWEGLYLSDWNTHVLTHPNAGAIGMTLREGDSLTSLRNSILSAADGVYNTGVMTSPASGQLIMSMYCPIMENGEPIGFVGCGFYVQTIAQALSDVSELNLSSAYIYFVDGNGIMLQHPDETKIGNPVENEAVKTLVAGLQQGQMPDPEVIEYTYKGTTKYAGYYIGENGNYIAVLTADESDVLAGVSSIRLTVIMICVACVILFTILALLVERVISVPLVQIAGSLNELSTGDVTAECKAKSHIKETVSIIDSFYALRDALGSSMRSVKDAAEVLNNSIIDVDDMTGKNVVSISQINTAVNEVAETSQSVALNAQNMAEKAMDLGSNVGT